MGDWERAWCGDRAGEGRLRTLEGCAYSMEQPYACTLYGVTAAVSLARPLPLLHFLQTDVIGRGGRVW